MSTHKIHPHSTPRSTSKSRPRRTTPRDDVQSPSPAGAGNQESRTSDHSDDDVIEPDQMEPDEADEAAHDPSVISTDSPLATEVRDLDHGPQRPADHDRDERMIEELTEIMETDVARRHRDGLTAVEREQDGVAEDPEDDLAARAEDESIERLPPAGG